jgi:hypothetical protein
MRTIEEVPVNLVVPTTIRKDTLNASMNDTDEAPYTLHMCRLKRRGLAIRTPLAPAASPHQLLLGFASNGNCGLY